MKTLKLDLSNEDKDKISALARECKYGILNKSESLYTNDIFEKLEILINSFRFLSAISNNSKIEEASKNKINDFLNTYKLIHNTALDFKFKSSRGELLKFKISKKLNHFLNNNVKPINLIIDEAFYLGRTIRMFDPDEEQGLM